MATEKVRYQFIYTLKYKSYYNGVCLTRIARYKHPKGVEFVKPDETESIISRKRALEMIFPETFTEYMDGNFYVYKQGIVD